MEVLRLLINKKQVAESFNTDFDKDFDKEFPVGAQIQVKFPQRFTIRNGLGYTPQGINRIATTVNLDQIFGIDFEWDDYEAAVKLERSMDQIRKQYLEPAADQLAQELDSRCAQFAYQNASNVVGTLGADPTTLATYLDADKRLFEKACPPGDRSLCLSASANASIVPQLQGLLNPSPEISRQYKTGVMGDAVGFRWYRSNSLYSHTAGTFAGAVTVSGGGQSGGSLVIIGTGGDTLKKGDKISILNVNAVNPVTRRIAGAKNPQNFTVLQDYTLTGGADTIQILPAIYGPGSQYQNVDALPAGGAAITLWPGTVAPNGKVGTVNLAMTKYGFALVGAKLYTPKAVEMATQHQDPETGLAVRFVKAWDPVRSMQVHRFDMLAGFGSLYQDNGAVCIAGA